MIRKAVKALIPRSAFKKVEPYGHLGEAVLLNARAGFPARGMNVIGITGTNGKTTTSFMVHRMLTEAGIKTGLMTTVAYGVGGDIKPQVQHMTTVPVPLLMKRLKAMKGQGIEWLVLETTSHALAQYRVWGVPYSVAVMTNLTHEHLDYHGTFERYRDAKVKLFKLVGSNKKGLRTGIVNAEDPNADYFAREVPKAIRYGVGEGDLRAEGLKTTPTGSTFTAVSGNRRIPVEVHLPGRFNVSNALAAAGVGIALGLTDEQISRGISALKTVEGRMNTLETGTDFSVIIDFAHTPDSFEKLLPEVKAVTKGRLITVFGSAGRRDESKRAIQGALAGKFSDVVVVTEEDDRDVNGLAIMDQIAHGAEREGKVRDKDLFLVHDRTEAIRYAVGLAKAGDTVLLLGKGHEKTIERADGEHPWDEAAAAREAIAART